MSSSSTSQRQQLQLTIGCEFEFILLIRKRSGKGPDNEDNDIAARDLIRNAFKTPFGVICEQCGKKAQFLLPMNSEETDDDSKWQVAHERTLWLQPEEIKLLGEDYDDYDIHPLELRSRILNADNQSGVLKSPCQHNVTRAEEMTAVMDRLFDDFRHFDRRRKRPKRFFLYVNRSCGFHVHIGRHGQPFSFPMVKRLLSLTIACERQIDQLHAVDRITGFDLQEPPHALPQKAFQDAPKINHKTWNLPYSMLFTAEANDQRWKDFEFQRQASNSSYKAVVGPFVGKTRWLQKSYSKQDLWIAKRLVSIDAWLIRIQTCNTIKALQTLVRGQGKRCILNLDNLSDDPDTAKLGTIEFRQHKGTLLPEEVCTFIDFLIPLVTFCYNMGDDLYRTFDGPGRAYRQPNFTLQELCANIGCREWAQLVLYTKHDPVLRAFSASLEKQQKHFERVTYNDPMKHLAMYAIKDEIRRTNPSNVQDRIKRKLLAGAYGQFPLKFLQAALPEEFADGGKSFEYLVNGYVVDVDPDNVNIAPPGTAVVDVEGYSSDEESVGEDIEVYFDAESQHVDQKMRALSTRD